MQVFCVCVCSIGTCTCIECVGALLVYLLSMYVEGVYLLSVY